MRFFVRAVVQGFALALGAALFKKIQDRVGLGEPKEKDKEKDQEPSVPEVIREIPPEPEPDRSS